MPEGEYGRQRPQSKLTPPKTRPQPKSTKSDYKSYGTTPTFQMSKRVKKALLTHPRYKPGDRGRKFTASKFMAKAAMPFRISDPTIILRRYKCRTEGCRLQDVFLALFFRPADCRTFSQRCFFALQTAGRFLNVVFLPCRLQDVFSVLFFRPADCRTFSQRCFFALQTAGRFLNVVFSSCRLQDVFSTLFFCPADCRTFSQCCFFALQTAGRFLSVVFSPCRLRDVFSVLLFSPCRLRSFSIPAAKWMKLLDYKSQTLTIKVSINPCGRIHVQHVSQHLLLSDEWQNCV